MKIRIPRINSVNFWLLSSLILSFFLEILVQTSVVADDTKTKITQYILLLLPIFLSFIQTLINKSKNRNKFAFETELKLGIVLASVFLLLTLYASYKARMFFMFSLLEVVQILLPFIITFVVINYISPENIHTFMKIALIIVLVGLFYDLGDKLLDFRNYAQISILRSYSPFENNIFPQFAGPLGVYFVYNMKKSPIMAVLALFINFLIFKRVLLLMIIGVFCLRFFRLDEKFKRIGKYENLFIVFWFFIVCFTYYMYLPENSAYFQELLNVNFASFTMARIYRFWYVLERGFTPYGLGSAAAFLRQERLSYIGIDFELDFIKTMFEIGPFAILTYIYVMIKICRRNLYAIFVISFYFLNYLMANGMYQFWSVSLIAITIAYINYGKSTNEIVKSN